MGNLNASYRLVYFQPDPEDGERVSVALLFVSDGKVDLLYDPEFPRLKCLSPNVDPAIVHLYLKDLAFSLKDAGSNVESLMLAQSPHFITSEKRKVASPLTDKIRVQLLDRFLGKKAKAALTKEEAISRSIASDINAHLRELIEAAHPDVSGRLRETRHTDEQSPG